MSLGDRVRSRLREERGFTLIELLVSMVILMTVMGGLTALMTSGTSAEAELNRRFQAQSEAHVALASLRRDGHCASGASVTGATLTLTVSTSCPTSGGGTSLTWCTIANGSYYGLWRYLGGACSGTGRKVADYLTTQNAFVYVPASGSSAAGTGKLATLALTFSVNLTPTKAERSYDLQDTIALRNTTRPA